MSDSDRLFWDRADALERVVAAERSRAKHGEEAASADEVEWYSQQLVLIAQLKDLRRQGPHK